VSEIGDVWPTRQLVQLIADLLYAMLEAGFRAGLHLWLFNDLRAMLHPDAKAGAFAFVYRVTHAETAPAGRLGLGRWRGAAER
jgi:hypothetical protein